MIQRRLPAMPWAEGAVLAALWLGILAYAIPLLLIGPTAEALGASSEYTDIGDAFEKAGLVAKYGDEALARAVANNPLPDPPRILGDTTAARVAWVYAIISAALFALVAMVAARRSPRQYVRDLGLGRFDIDRLWVPGLAVAVLYLGIGVYVRAVNALGIDALQSESGGLETTMRDGLAFTLYGLTTVIAAPIGEEFFYRGLIFGGLSSWGFLPAAFVSSVLFAFSHLDPATLIPFAAVGFVLSWLYWRSGSLWDAIVFHVLFNLLSFILLLARTT